MNAPRLGVILCCVLALAATSAVAVTAQQTGGQTQEIQSCTNITASGTYVLTADITSATDVCIQIAASNVTLSGEGRTVTGNGSGLGISTFETNRDNVTVSNVTVSNWEAGISASGSTNVTVQNVAAVNNTDGVRTSFAFDVAVRNVTATNNTRGVVLESARNSTVRGVTATDNAVGLRLLDADGVGVANTTSTGNIVGASLRLTDDASFTSVNLSDNGEGALSAEATDGPFVAQTLQIGNATVDARGRNVSVAEVGVGPTPPDNRTAVGGFLAVQPLNASGWFDVAIRYTDDAVAGIDESALALWRFQNDSWTELESSVDADRNRVAGNVTAAGTVGILADGTTPPPESTATATQANATG